MFQLQALTAEAGAPCTRMLLCLSCCFLSGWTHANRIDIDRQENCHGQELQVHFPGYENLVPLGWNDKVRSFNCAAE